MKASPKKDLNREELLALLEDIQNDTKMYLECEPHLDDETLRNWRWSNNQLRDEYNTTVGFTAFPWLFKSEPKKEEDESPKPSQHYPYGYPEY